MKYTPPIDYLIRQSIKKFIALSLVLAASLVAVRFYEMIFISGKAGYPTGSTIDGIMGIPYDLTLTLRFGAWLLLPFLLLDHYRPVTARNLFIGLAVAMVTGNVMLIRYFAATRIPLGSDLFGYSLAEIRQTVGASGEMGLGTLFPIFFFAAVSGYVLYKYGTFRINNTVMVLYLVLLLFSILPFSSLVPDPTDFRSEFRMNISANKLGLFTVSVARYFGEKPALGGIDPESPEGRKMLLSNATPAQDSNPSSVTHPDNTGVSTYLSSDYPFLRTDRTPDLLSPFFDPKIKEPNIIFIVVESLGRAYSGPNAYLGSFTPFLDSLMQKSLYWENCLSSSGRTFSVLPTLLGSLPFGDKGFAELGSKAPAHLSMISFLKKQAGYSSAFYYGGNPSFDSMEPFLRGEGTTRIVGEFDFGSGYEKLPSDRDKYTWGYGDRELFRKYLQDLKVKEGSKRMDVLLTLAMHSPFLVPNQQHYNQMVENRMNDLKLSEHQKEYNRQYIPQFATMLYFDDALRYFMTEFSHLSSFANTIFVITGDHRMPEIPISTQLDRFHVPLVVYSPSVTKPQKFSAIVNHFDVTPSLMTLLGKRMGIKMPAVTTWIGRGLDTNVSFRSIGTYPMKRNATELTDYLNGNFFLSGSTLYAVSPTLDIEPINNPSVNQRMQTEFNIFKTKNSIITKGNYLVPDSLLTYIKH
ncbi:MAG: LTA synthase family protein [Marinilabiliales bacterium]|nr:LTA synthase family protein [Marinilabiliales bacterium]